MTTGDDKTGGGEQLLIETTESGLTPIDPSAFGQTLPTPTVEEQRRRAAETGNPNAWFKLGVHLSKGEFPRDLAEAALWLRRAADAGIVNAATRLVRVSRLQEKQKVELLEGRSFESIVQEAKGHVSRLEVGLRTELGVGLSLAVDGCAFPLDLYSVICVSSLARSAHNHGRYWFRTCRCGDPDCVGIQDNCTVIHEGERTAWLVETPELHKTHVFDTGQYRRAILDELEKLVDHLSHLPEPPRIVPEYLTIENIREIAELTRMKEEKDEMSPRLAAGRGGPRK